MTVSLTNLERNGSQAEATVSIVPSGGNAAQGMTMKYHLEEKGGKWVVVGRQDAAGSPHGGAAAPAAAPADPHGGATEMPSPEDLPPAKKQ